MSEFDLAALEQVIDSFETLDIRNRDGAVDLTVMARDGQQRVFTHIGAWWWLAVGDEYVLIEDGRVINELTMRAVCPQVQFYWLPGARCLTASWQTIRRAGAFFYRSKRVKARFRLYRKNAIYRQFEKPSWTAEEIDAAVSLLRESGMAT